jgi:omega-amidase
MTLAISLFQSELAWENVQTNLDKFGKRMNSIKSTDLMILPEMFSTGFSMRSAALAENMDGRTVNWMLERALQHNSTVCGSVIIREGDNFLNRFIWAEPTGKLQYYDKKHLFRMSEENENYTPGSERLIVQLNGFNICPQVCYDLRFPVFSRNTQQNDNEAGLPYDLLLYVANWPAARYTHWRALLQARAIENQAFVVGVNRIGLDGNDILYRGDSCVINYQGEFLEDLENKDQETSTSLDRAPLASYRKNFPAWKDSDDFKLQ